MPLRTSRSRSRPGPGPGRSGRHAGSRPAPSRPDRCRVSRGSTARPPADSARYSPPRGSVQPATWRRPVRETLPLWSGCPSSGARDSKASISDPFDKLVILQSIFRLAARRRPSDSSRVRRRAGDREMHWTKAPRRRWLLAFYGRCIAGRRHWPGSAGTVRGQVGDRRRPAAMAVKVVVQPAARISDAGRPPRRLREQRTDASRMSMRES